MRTIYVINFRMTGWNGDIGWYSQDAFLSIEKAEKELESITKLYKDDPNFMAYICGPIVLNED